MKKICVLLSTYNGEQYLEEQLNSLIMQEGVDVSILVRDDGSNDSTCDILNKWQDRGLLTWYSGENKGFAKSFLDLVQKSSEYDYYAFCDQDDIWLPSKIKQAIQCMLTLSNPIQLYCSNTILYKDGENVGLLSDKEPKSNLYTCLIRSISPGCTMVFNKGLRDEIASVNPEYIIAHDLWVYQVATFMGEVYYDINAYIYYRQHSNNQIGVSISRRDLWVRRYRSFFMSNKSYGFSLQAQELLQCYVDKFGKEQLKAIKLLAFYKRNLWKRFQLMCDARYSMPSVLSNVLLRIKILCGRL